MAHADKLLIEVEAPNRNSHSWNYILKPLVPKKQIWRENHFQTALSVENPCDSLESEIRSQMPQVSFSQDAARLLLSHSLVFAYLCRPSLCLNVKLFRSACPLQVITHKALVGVLVEVHWQQQRVTASFVMDLGGKIKSNSWRRKAYQRCCHHKGLLAFWMLIHPLHTVVLQGSHAPRRPTLCTSWESLHDRQ